MKVTPTLNQALDAMQLLRDAAPLGHPMDKVVDSGKVNTDGTLGPSVNFYRHGPDVAAAKNTVRAFVSATGISVAQLESTRQQFASRTRAGIVTSAASQPIPGLAPYSIRAELHAGFAQRFGGDAKKAENHYRFIRNYLVEAMKSPEGMEQAATEMKGRGREFKLDFMWAMYSIATKQDGAAHMTQQLNRNVEPKLEKLGDSDQRVFDSWQNKIGLI